MVTINRVSSGLSPRAFRKCEMYCARFPSSTNVSPHTACSNSSFVTRRLGFCAKKSRTSKAFGVSGTGESARESVRFRESRENRPKLYKWLMAGHLGRVFKVFHRFSKSSERLPRNHPLRIVHGRPLQLGNTERPLLSWKQSTLLRSRRPQR